MLFTYLHLQLASLIFENHFRLVLSAASEYFATMFTGSLSNNDQREITLVDINGDVLQAVVNYCYTGTIEIRLV